MVTEKAPKVVIGLPVYNGENYLGEAIESILNQTFTDFRLVISDNCSQDATAGICERYAKQDNRVVYHRQSENIGAARNYNFVFRPDGAPYFKWAAHDDVLEPDFLRQTVELLDTNPCASIAHCRSWQINKNGVKTQTYDNQLSLRADTVEQRFWHILWANYFTEVFGLMRSEAIARTNLHGSYVGSDRNFMAEMLMQGNVAYSRDLLFCRRDHPNCYVRALVNKGIAAQQQWFDPKAGFALPTELARTGRYFKSVWSMPLSSSDRLACLGRLLQWCGTRALEKLHGEEKGMREEWLFNDESIRGLRNLEKELSL